MVDKFLAGVSGEKITAQQCYQVKKKTHGGYFMRKKRNWFHVRFLILPTKKKNHL